MKSRSQRPGEERHARSRAVQHIAENPLLRGSLVSMARTCGKAGCHCQQGQKHVSLYLSVRLNNHSRYFDAVAGTKRRGEQCIPRARGP